jgi:hypothetical protein
LIGSVVSTLLERRGLVVGFNSSREERTMVRSEKKTPSAE